jgi:hypothetical protein
MPYTRKNNKGMRGRTRKVRSMKGEQVGKKETWLGLVKKVHKEKKKNNKNWTFRDTLKSAKEIWKGVNKPIQQQTRVVGGDPTINGAESVAESVAEPVAESVAESVDEHEAKLIKDVNEFCDNKKSIELGGTKKRKYPLRRKSGKKRK